MPAGRPSKYKPEFCEQAEKLCRLGATDGDLADFFGVTERTISNWQVEHEEFFRALKTGKETADDRVERSLYQRAIGYSHAEDKVFMPAGAKEAVIVPTTKHCPPDTTACIFWLKNRRREEWRDKVETEISGDVKVSALKVEFIGTDSDSQDA